METNKTKTAFGSKKGIGIALGLMVLIASTSLALAQTGLSSDLLAGQNIPVGLATVSDDSTDVHVDVSTTGDWVITELHVQIADELSGIPQTKTGNPIPGKFEYNLEFTGPVTSYSLTKAISDLNLADNNVVVAVQADVYNTVTGQEETAWLTDPQQGLQFPGANWATYLEYTLGTTEVPPTE